MKKKRVRRTRKAGEGIKNESYTDKKLRERRIKQKKRRRRTNLLAFAGAMMGLLLVVGILYTRVQIIDLNSQISAKQEQIDNLDAEYTALKSQQQGILTLPEIEEYAENKLGLVRMDRSKEEYISVEKPSEVEVSSGSSGMEKLVSGFVRSFNAFLSFLK